MSVLNCTPASIRHWSSWSAANGGTAGTNSVIRKSTNLASVILGSVAHNCSGLFTSAAMSSADNCSALRNFLKHSSQVSFTGGVVVATAPSCTQVLLFPGWVHIRFSH